MSFIRQSQQIIFAALIGAVMVFGAIPALAQTALVLSESDTTATAGSDNAWISVYMLNPEDTVAGFTMRVVLDNPELVEFKTDVVDSIFDTTFQYCAGWQSGVCTLWVDTLIVDTILSSGAVDTAGSIISDWEYLTARSISEGRHDIKITGLADRLGPPYTPGIMPRTQPGLLFRMKLRVYSETADSNDNVANFAIIKNVSETNFSDPHGNLIGTITDYNIADSLYWYCTDWNGDECLNWIDTIPGAEDTIVVDTNWRYWFCQNMDGDSCTDWESVTGPPDTAAFADSTSIDSIPWTVLDTTATFYIDGSMEVSYISCTCGDMNDDGFVNVGDAVYLINHIFKGGPAPTHPECANVNGDAFLNVGDAVYMINFIFKGGSAPNCGF